MTHGRLSMMLSALCMFTVLGCGGATGPTRQALGGSITVNGVKLERGAISLRPIEGHSAPAAVTTVENGLYRFTNENGPVPGPYAVKINIDPESAQGKAIIRGATTPTGGQPVSIGPKGGSLAQPPPTHSPALPQLHWELKYTVLPEGSLTKDFELRH